MTTKAGCRPVRRNTRRERQRAKNLCKDDCVNTLGACRLILKKDGENNYRKFANAVIIAALKKSMNSDPTNGTIINAIGAGP